MGAFKDAHGGPLRNLYLDADAAEAAKRGSGGRRSWDLTERQLCDLELLLNGGFSPLDGFLGRADYESVLADMRLASGALWPIPITLDVTPAFAEQLELGQTIDLRDREGVLVATMTVTDRWQPDKRPRRWPCSAATTARIPPCATCTTMPAASISAARSRASRPPTHYDFKHLRDTPQELRDRFRKLGWRRVIAFQTRNPMHRAHQELTFRAAQAAEANLLDPARRRHDQARRRRPFHPRALLREAAAPLSRADHHAQPAAAGDAHGRPARGALARDHPQELRLHPPDRRPRPCRPGQRLRRQAVLRPVRGAGAVPAAPGRARRHHGAVPQAGLLADPRPVRAGGPGRARRDRAVALRHRAAPPAAGGPGDPGLVLVPRGGRGAAPHPPAAPPRRASPSSSPASPAPASRPSPTRWWSSCWSSAAAR